MTADPLAPLGAAPAAPGAGAPVCRACAHPHRVTARRYGTEVTYDQACGCGCTASGLVYELGLPAAILTEHYWPTVPRGAASRGPSAHVFILDEPTAVRAEQRGDDNRASRVDARGGVRRRRVGGLLRADISRLARHLGRQLVGLRGHDDTLAGRADRSRPQDRDTAAGSERVRGVVMW